MKKFYIIFGVVCIVLLVLLFNMKNETVQPPVIEKSPMEELPHTSGLHIMRDGAIMDGMGKPVQNATILEDGNIRLEDGKVYIPMADFRK